MSIEIEKTNALKYYVRSHGVSIGTIQRNVKILFPQAFNKWTFFPNAGVFSEGEILAIGQKLVELNKTTD